MTRDNATETVTLAALGPDVIGLRGDGRVTPVMAMEAQPLAPAAATAIEQCLAAKAARFIVRDDGAVFLEPKVNGPLLQIAAMDAEQCVEFLLAMPAYGRSMVEGLVPDSSRGDWNLRVQREVGYGVFTPMYQYPPTLADLGFAVPSGD